MRRGVRGSLLSRWTQSEGFGEIRLRHAHAASPDTPLPTCHPPAVAPGFASREERGRSQALATNPVLSTARLLPRRRLDTQTCGH